MRMIIRQYILPVLWAVGVGYFCYSYDSFREFLAAMYIVMVPPAFAFWFIVHPFIDFWRRIGAVWTYIITISLLALMGYGIAQTLGYLPQFDFRPNIWTLIPGMVTIAFSIFLSTQWRQHLKFKTLVGIPELSPQKHPGKLLTEGIYAKIRHPRYLEGIIGFLGWALVLNYPAVYGVMLWSWIAIYITTLIEEKELRQRFGREYEEYCRRVPRLIPKIGSVKN